MWLTVVRIASFAVFFHILLGCQCDPDAKRLYEDLNCSYNKLVRPGRIAHEPLVVKMRLKLTQLVEINMKNQLMTTNLWMQQTWYDDKLSWDPEKYGGIKVIQLPSKDIWKPDIVLYNNADGSFEAALVTKAIINYTGQINWSPPSISKSSCKMNVEYFPFDEQTCFMKFGSWSYDGTQIDLRHGDDTNSTDITENGFDFSEFYKSVEWDIIAVPAKRTSKKYVCCVEPYIDITFSITVRRKPLFYIVNLIIPCTALAYLTILVFYLPSDSGEKINLSISILLSLTVFLMLLAETVPPTSLAVPLIGKFVLFTMTIDILSIFITVVVLNIHFRSAQTHRMPNWVRRVFIDALPRFLFMQRPQDDRKPTKNERNDGPIHKNKFQTDSGYLEERDDNSHIKFNSSEEKLSSFQVNDYADISRPSTSGGTYGYGKYGTSFVNSPANVQNDDTNLKNRCHFCMHLHKTSDQVKYIADYTKREQQYNEVKEDWKYVATVIDRMFLWIFTIAVVSGSAMIILQAPSLYDKRKPIEGLLAEV